MTPLTSNVVVDPPSTARVDIVLPEGRAYAERVARFVDDEGDPVDISLWAFTLDIRRDYGGTVVVECTLGNGRLATNTTLGHVVLNLSALDVAALGIGRFFYDLRVQRPVYANLWYPAAGTLTVTPQITR